jgi:hypothetical protein
MASTGLNAAVVLALATASGRMVDFEISDTSIKHSGLKALGLLNIATVLKVRIVSTLTLTHFLVSV